MKKVLALIALAAAMAGASTQASACLPSKPVVTTNCPEKGYEPVCKVWTCFCGCWCWYCEPCPVHSCHV